MGETNKGFWLSPEGKSQVCLRYVLDLLSVSVLAISLLSVGARMLITGYSCRKTFFRQVRAPWRLAVVAPALVSRGPAGGWRLWRRVGATSKARAGPRPSIE